MTDRMPTPGTLQASQIGQMVVPGARHHRLNGLCPDGGACSLPIHCSQLCSRLESEEITAEMQASVRAHRTNGKSKPPAPTQPKAATT